jgi:hypothetical protein
MDATKAEKTFIIYIAFNFEIIVTYFFCSFGLIMIFCLFNYEFSILGEVLVDSTITDVLFC